ncbi:MAG: restriction endonuclease subunit S [Selenomonas sp.]|nr:restriction endonuclease subunit S [Selenomonas sp.]
MVIPENWAKKQLSDIVAMKSGETITSERIFDNAEYPCYGGNGLRGYTDKYTHEGEFALVGRQGALCGNVNYANGRFYASEHAVVVTPYNNTDIRFMYYLLTAMNLNQYATSSAQPGLAVNKILELECVVPESKAEQKLIAQALSDIDNLISTQEALIAKKQAIKQGAMQELLTEKRRLAGFREKWNRVTLGDIGGLYKGSGISRADMGTGDIAAIRYGELYTFYGAYTHEINTRISAEVAEEAFGLQYGDIVFAGSGETHEEIGKCTAYVLDEKAYAGGDTIILRPNVKCHSVYLGYLLNTSQVQEQKAALGQGDAVVHISAKSLSTIEVELPKYEEQVAIGEMLLDIDNDIANQQAKLEKLRRIKSGMMDKLLTGKIRLTD